MALALGDFGRLNPSPIHGWSVDLLDFIPVAVNEDGELITTGGGAGTPTEVVGNVADSAADSGNPVKVGYKALAFGANPTAVAAGERVNAYATVAGIPFTLGGHPNVITRRDNYTSAQTDTAIVTVSAGTKIALLSQTVAADNANTVDVAVRTGFGATTTPTGAGTYLSHPGIAAGSGIREAGLVVGGDGEDLRITSEVATTGSIDVVTKYFTISE